ncbi:radical SAM protein [Malonomonas rubra]|nr:radical SAM protein [Malonomonas rubra]
MLRQFDGQRIAQEKLLRKFSNHSLFSLLPCFDGIESLFEKSDDKSRIAAKTIQALQTRINREINLPENNLEDISYSRLASSLLPIVAETLKKEASSTLETGARVRVKLDSSASYAKPGSEGFIVEKLEDAAKVKFYSITGRYGVEMFTMEIPDEDLEVLGIDELLQRHQDFTGIAQYFFNDSMLRAMKSQIDSSVYTFAARTAIEYLVAEGFLKREGDQLISVPSKNFSVLAPRLDATYRNEELFSSHSLSSPPSERKPHVLRLELTTGCDYNRCTFCTEYAGMKPVTKSFEQFKEHVDRVTESIGSEKSRIERLFIGSGNTLAVETELLLKSLNYAASIFEPQRISLYGRTSSILQKSVDDLKRLKEAGFSLIYWGLESGSDEVLNYVCKDCTRADMIEAARRLAEAEIEVSAMMMPGVGGLKLSDAHVAGSIELLHNIEITYLTLLAINPSESSQYARNMLAEADNRHLTPEEVNAQVYQLLEGLNPSGIQIGMFTEEVDQVSSNTLRFNNQFSESNKELLLRDFWN